MELAPKSEVPRPALDSRDASATMPAPPGVRESGEEHPMQLDPSEQELIRAGAAAPAIPGSFSPGIPRSADEPRSPFGVAALLDLLGWIWRAPLRFVAAGFAIYILAFNLSVVRGSSMAPGIHDGDRILIDQVSYLFQEVERGDVVVLRYPLDPTLDYIKRVVALPGDEVVMAGGRLWVNGQGVEEPYVDQVDPYTHLYVRVKEGHFFVLGDNRMHSSDSREFGQVAEGLLRGKVELRLWPPTRLGRIR